jgi:transcriptional regulatory protein RtcR
LRKADGGVLFLDEIGELGSDEQAMLLRAIEDKAFYPVGSDKEVSSDFQLIAGTNRDLNDGFRDDLLARINQWSFRLPSLRERPEDIEPNLEHELALLKTRVTFNKEARAKFLRFAANAPWPANFRDFGAAVRRMATLAVGGRIGVAEVDEEVGRLRGSWSKEKTSPSLALLDGRPIDRFDRVQLDDVLNVCRNSKSMSEAGRTLFAASFKGKQTKNDADRLRKYLARFGLEWKDIERT